MRLLLQTVVIALVAGLALMIMGRGHVAAAVHESIIPYFDQRIALDGEHVLVIHSGPSPTCLSTPNPPQHDCLRPGLQPREFWVFFLTQHGVRPLLWFRLPEL
jgi:hypothetical protein